VASELRYGSAKKASPRLTAQVDAILGALDTLAHAVALDFTLVTDNVKEFSRVSGLRIANWLRD
jgi:tRNA(fMet)-specific endonuclease VapC